MKVFTLNGIYIYVYIYIQDVTYLLSFIFAIVSIFFIIIKAITLGDQKTFEWLITIITGLLSENILISPIKVI